MIHGNYLNTGMYRVAGHAYMMSCEYYSFAVREDMMSCCTCVMYRGPQCAVGKECCYIHRVLRDFTKNAHAASDVSNRLSMLLFTLALRHGVESKHLTEASLAR